MRTNDAPTASPTTTTKPCECGHWWVGTVTDVEAGTVENERTTDCTATTARTFAQGHDARLLSFLVRAAVDGLEAHDGRGTSGDPVDLAARFGFGHKVKAGVERAADKAKARAERAANREAAKTGREAPAQTPQTVAIKIGRWTHQALIDPSGTATYETSKGQRQAEAGSYTVVQTP